MAATRILVLSIAFALSAVARAAAPAPASAPAPVVAYVGATLIDGAGGARANTVIVTQGSVITAVRSAAGFEPEPGAEVVDVRGRFVIPGLVNSHVHLATLAEPAVARAYLRRELYSGVTAVRDMAGDVRLLAELEREADLDEIASPDIVYAAVMAGPTFFVDPRTHDSARGRVAGAVPWMQAITATTDLPNAIAQARGTGATAIKLYADLPASLVRALTAEAHRQGMRVWAHAAVMPALPSEVVDAGVDVVSHACLLSLEIAKPPIESLATVRSLDPAIVMRPNPAIATILEAMKRRGTILDATLFTFEGSPSRACAPGTNDYLAREAYRAGVAISAGTDDDADWKDTDSELDTELELLVSRVGMTPLEALRAATMVGARTLGLESTLGSIEPGKLADLVVLERDPLKDIANIRSVTLVVKHGIRYPHTDYKPATDADFRHPAP